MRQEADEHRAQRCGHSHEWPRKKLDWVVQAHCGILSARMNDPAFIVFVLLAALLRNVSETLPALVPATT
jgi:hypothetical protein